MSESLEGKDKKEEKKLVKVKKKEEKKEKKKVKKVNKELRKISAGEEEIYEIKKKRYIFETIVIVLLAVFMLLLLCNRTFFREEYKTDKINIEIPLLSFFVKDDGEQIVLKTLRKSEYVKEFFENSLSNLNRYSCNYGESGFYYDEVTNTAIYSIDVEKSFAVKTIIIKYQKGDINKLCQ